MLPDVVHVVSHHTEVETWDKFGELDDVKILLATPLPPVQWWAKQDFSKTS